MLARVESCGLNGLNGFSVVIEADVSGGHRIRIRAADNHALHPGCQHRFRTRRLFSGVTSSRNRAASGYAENSQSKKACPSP